MNIELFSSSERLVLLLSLAISLPAAGIMAALRVPTRWTAAPIAIALAAGGALLLELSAALLVAGSAGSAFNDYRWVLLSPWGRLELVLAIAASSVILVLAVISTAGMPPIRRTGIVALRTAATATALIIFLQPAVELRQVAREPNRIAILVDDSKSMALRDGKDAPDRQTRAMRILKSSSDTLAKWRKAYLLDFYTFSDTLAPAALESLASAKPEGEATLLRQALEQVRARYEGADLGGVVVLSDGIVTGELENSGQGDLRSFIRSLDTPIHPVWVGRPGLRDISITDLRADEFAFVRTVTRVEATVRSTGYKKQRIPVLLSSDGHQLRRKWVELDANDSEKKVFFEFTPAKVGKYVYEISTPIATEEAVKSNNSQRFVVRVIRDKIRVLQVAGQPSWDVRALRGMLKQNPNVDLISFFILRTFDDISQAPTSELSLIPFPTQELFQEQLPSFDLIVLQNFDFEPYGISQYLENIRSYIEGGGALVMLGGSLSFASGRYTGTPVADALPVELPSPYGGSDDLLDLRTFRPELTKQGQGHPITTLRFERGDNQVLWRSLPELHGANVVLGAKPEATVLAKHPTLRSRDGDPMPIIVAGDYGEGRTLAVMSDSLWRWGFLAAQDSGNDGRHYLKFWDNAIRWLIQDPELRHLHVDSDRVSYEPGTKVRLDLRLVDLDYSPRPGGTINLQLRRGFDPGKTKAIAKAKLVTDDSGTASHEFEDLTPGVYRAHGRATLRGKRISAQDIFLVGEASEEDDRPSADAAVLEQISQASGGTMLANIKSLPANLRFTEPQIVRIDRRSDVELWSRPWLLALALLFLGLEWALRQRSGTL